MQDVVFSRGKRTCLCQKMSRQALGYKADNSPPSSARSRMTGAIPLCPLHAIMTCTGTTLPLCLVQWHCVFITGISITWAMCFKVHHWSHIWSLLHWSQLLSSQCPFSLKSGKIVFVLMHLSTLTPICDSLCKVVTQMVACFKIGCVGRTGHKELWILCTVSSSVSLHKIMPRIVTWRDSNYSGSMWWNLYLASGSIRNFITER